MAGRPVLTSRLSNAVDVLAGAVLEARGDDPADYASKIEALADAPQRYADLVSGTAALRDQFMNPAFGLTAALERCLLGDAASSTTRANA
jgi:hypothetical protein